MEKIIKQFECEVKEFSDEDLTVVHFISTEKKDRLGDIVRANGMRIFGKPVVLVAHDHRGEPWAKPEWIKKGKHKGYPGIMAKTKYFPDDTGRRLYRKAKENYMPNWSIGFRSIKDELIDPEKGPMGGIEYKEWELLEYSQVAVPAHPDATTLSNEYKDVPPLRIKMMEENYAGGRDPFAGDVYYEKEFETDIVIDLESLEGYRLLAESEPVAPEDVEKPYPNYHACRLKDPKQYDRIRRQKSRFGEGIDALWGVKGKKVELQALQFDKRKFTAADAKKWCKDHKYTCRPFEPATEASMEGIIDLDKEFETVEKFVGSPRNPFGSHCSYQFKGGIDGYKAAWRCHFSQVGGGALTPAASGPIRGTVRRCAMIAAAMKPPCKLVGTDAIGPRTGPKSPLDCTFPQKPSDYGLSRWKKPKDEDVDPEVALRFKCSDLNIIKRAALAEIKRRIKDREAREGKGAEPEELQFFEEMEALEYLLCDVSVAPCEEGEDFEKDMKVPDNVQLTYWDGERLHVFVNKIGAVLNKANKAKLIEAVNNIKSVLDSAESPTSEDQDKTSHGQFQDGGNYIKELLSPDKGKEDDLSGKKRKQTVRSAALAHLEQKVGLNKK